MKKGTLTALLADQRMQHFHEIGGIQSLSTKFVEITILLRLMRQHYELCSKPTSGTVALLNVTK